MSRFLTVQLLLALLCPMVSADNQSYFEDRERGWYWYEDPKEKEKKEDLELKSQDISNSLPLSPREKLKKQGEDWEDSLATAILNPTKENYTNYLSKTAQIQKQSQDFATGFKQSVWVTPEFDYKLEKPRNSQAIIASNQESSIQNKRSLREISRRNGLIFFFRSDCPYCHSFAPILKNFAGLYGFTVIPVSLDGKGLDEYPYPKKNYDLGRKLNVSTVPSLFLINPDSNTVSTVGYGYSSMTQLINKVLFAAKQMDGTANIKVGDVR